MHNVCANSSALKTTSALDMLHLVTLHCASCPPGKGEDTEMNRGGKRDDNYESHPYDDIEVEDDGDDKQMLCF